MDRKKAFDLIRKTIILVAGLFMLALGVALSIRSDLGVSPSSSVSYLFAKIFPVSMGTVTIAVNLIYILIQILLLKKEFRLMNLLQLVAVILFGYFTDYTLALTSDVVLISYPVRFLFCIVSCALMGIGLYLEINAHLLTMASEGALSVIAKKCGKDFGTIKIINDILFVFISVTVSLFCFHKIDGVREGTFISAVLVGFFSRLCTRHLPLFKKGKEPETYVVADKYPLVITIEREFGSGGHQIGKKLAKELGMFFYDYELIEKVAEETGMAYETIRKKEERVPGLWYSLYDQNYGYTNKESNTDAIFDAQKKIIRHIAGMENCVIVGRLGSYILRNRPNTFNIFISADRDYRAKRLSENRGIDEKEMLKIIEKEDNMRKHYCMHFTGRPWGLARHYHLSVDSSIYGIQGSYEIISNALKEFVRRRQQEN